ncbi:hypothetical protein GW916_06585 [bacterium]|nr:hypothetical protein [bacterium]
MSQILDTIEGLEIVQKTKTFFSESLVKLENSQVYENILGKYEELDPKHQHWIASGSRIAALGLFAYFVISPFLTVWHQKSVLSEQRSLLAEMKTFNEQLETQPRPAPQPPDWQVLPADTSDAAMSSVKGFLESIGLPDGSYSMLSSSNGHLQLEVPQLNLRQAQALIYQVDGWYPKLVSQVLNVKVHPEDKQQLKLAMTIRHESGAPFSANSGSSSGTSSGSNRPNRSSYTPPPSSPPPPAANQYQRSEPSNIITPPPEDYEAVLNEQESRDETSSDNGIDRFEDDAPIEFESSDDSLPPPPMDDEDF